MLRNNVSPCLVSIMTLCDDCLFEPAQNGHINGQIVGSLGLIGFWLTAIRNPQYGQNAAVSQLLSLVVHKRDVKWQVICGTI